MPARTTPRTAHPLPERRLETRAHGRSGNTQVTSCQESSGDRGKRPAAGRYLRSRPLIKAESLRAAISGSRSPRRTGAAHALAFRRADWWRTSWSVCHRRPSDVRVTSRGVIDRGSDSPAHVTAGTFGPRRSSAIGVWVAPKGTSRGPRATGRSGKTRGRGPAGADRDGHRVGERTPRAGWCGTPRTCYMSPRDKGVGE